MSNKYCNLKRDFNNCELKTWDNNGNFTGIECPDCKHCKTYRYLPDTLNVGDTIEFIGDSKKCTNRYGGKFTIPIKQNAKITGIGFNKDEYTVKRLQYPFTGELLHRNQIIRLVENK